MARRRSSRRRSSDVSPAALAALAALGAATAYPWVALALGLLALVVLLCVWALRRSRHRREREALLQLEMAEVDAMDPLAFEVLVAHLLNAQGYRTQLTKGSGDFGVDVVASNGQRRIAVQVKRYRDALSAKPIGEVLGGHAPLPLQRVHGRDQQHLHPARCPGRSAPPLHSRRQTRVGALDGPGPPAGDVMARHSHR
jgi:HJR/Mrr/RecB family endonuclease